MNKTRFRAAAIAAAMVVLATGMAVSSADAKTFRWAFQGDAQTLDPQGLFETFTLGFHSNIYEPLVAYDSELKIRPALATEWKLVDDTTWNFKLREGVKFHNGNPFTADDVIFTWKRAATEGSQMKSVAAKITAINKINDHEINIVTPSPLPTLVRELVFLYIMDKEWSEANNTTTATATDVDDKDAANFANLNTNGTGPFKIVERQVDVRTVIERNTDYWGEVEGNVTKGIFTPVKENATRVAALISGELDLVYPVPVQDWPRLEEISSVQVLAGAEARTIFLGFDQLRDELVASDVKGKNPFKDKRVRLAFAHAIDIDAINQKIMRGAADPTSLMTSPQIAGYDATLDERWAHDPERAKALLEEAGYGEGFSVQMDCPNNRYVNDEKICQAVVGMLAKIGISVDLLAQPKSKYFGKVNSPRFDTSFYLLGWTPTSMDAHNTLSHLVACRASSGSKGLYNLGGYCNESIDELVDRFASEINHEKRNALISEAMRIHHEEVGHIPLHNQPLSWGVRTGVEVAQRADNVLEVRTVVIE